MTIDFTSQDFDDRTSLHGNELAVELARADVLKQKVNDKFGKMLSQLIVDEENNSFEVKKVLPIQKKFRIIK